MKHLTLLSLCLTLLLAFTLVSCFGNEVKPADTGTDAAVTTAAEPNTQTEPVSDIESATAVESDASADTKPASDIVTEPSEDCSETDGNDPATDVVTDPVENPTEADPDFPTEPRDVVLSAIKTISPNETQKLSMTTPFSLAMYQKGNVQYIEKSGYKLLFISRYGTIYLHIIGNDIDAWYDMGSEEFGIVDAGMDDFSEFCPETAVVTDCGAAQWQTSWCELYVAEWDEADEEDSCHYRVEYYIKGGDILDMNIVVTTEMSALDEVVSIEFGVTPIEQVIAGIDEIPDQVDEIDMEGSMMLITILMMPEHTEEYEDADPEITKKYRDALEDCKAAFCENDAYGFEMSLDSENSNMGKFDMPHNLTVMTTETNGFETNIVSFVKDGKAYFHFMREGHDRWGYTKNLEDYAVDRELFLSEIAEGLDASADGFVYVGTEMVDGKTLAKLVCYESEWYADTTVIYYFDDMRLVRIDTIESYSLASYRLSVFVTEPVTDEEYADLTGGMETAVEMSDDELDWEVNYDGLSEQDP